MLIRIVWYLQLIDQNYRLKKPVISSIPVIITQVHVTAMYMESEKQYWRLWYHIPKIELARGVLTSLPKSAQGLLLRPETASFLMKIFSGYFKSFVHALHQRPPIPDTALWHLTSDFWPLSFTLCTTSPWSHFIITKDSYGMSSTYYNVSFYIIILTI